MVVVCLFLVFMLLFVFLFLPVLCPRTAAVSKHETGPVTKQTTGAR